MDSETFISSPSGKTILESLLLDDREERVKMIAGLTYGAAFGTRNLAQALFDIDAALDKDPKAARARLMRALKDAKDLHETFHANLMSLVSYVERKRPEVKS